MNSREDVAAERLRYPMTRWAAESSVLIGGSRRRCENPKECAVNSMMMDMMSKDMAKAGMSTTDMSVLEACLDACSACEQASIVCSMEMTPCAPACMNCAAMCNTMMNCMLRMQGMTREVTMSMLDATIATCQMCMDECMAHAEDSEVSRMCAQSCKACMDACMALKNSLMKMA